MPIMPDRIKQQVKQVFEKKLQGDVKLLTFFAPAQPGEDRPYDGATREMVAELLTITEKLTTAEYTSDSPEAQQYGVTMFPAIVVLGDGDRDFGVRYFGAPLGYEFGTLVEMVADASVGTTMLSEATRQALQNVQKDVVIEVFSTPT